MTAFWEGRMKDKTGIERPWLFRAIRVGEKLGLLTLIFGLAASEWLIAAAGAGVIVASYQLYRSRFPAGTSSDNGSMAMSDGGD
jgi:hypothetical protein